MKKQEWIEFYEQKLEDIKIIRDRKLLSSEYDEAILDGEKFYKDQLNKIEAMEWT